MKLFEVIAELRDANEAVPKPPRLPTEVEVAAAEKKLGVKFHPDYRTYLLEASDVTYGTLEPAMITPNAGHLDLVELANDAWEMGVSKKLLPFCESNGDYFCLRPDGSVVFWSEEETEEEWSDLAHWILEVWLEGDEEDGDEDEDED